MAHPTEALDLGLGLGAGPQPHAELAQDPVAVEHRGAVDLGQNVHQRRQVRRVEDRQCGRDRPAGLEMVRPVAQTWTGALAVVHQDRPDAPGAQVVHGDLEQRLDHLALLGPGALDEGLHPLAHRRLLLPGDPVPAQDPELAGHPHHARRVALHDDPAGRLGQHDDVALGTRGPVEHDQLVVRRVGPQEVVHPADHPAGQAVGEHAGAGQPTVGERAGGDGEPGRGLPSLPRAGRGDDRPVARDATLMDPWPHCVVELAEGRLGQRRGSGQHEAGVGELLDQTSAPTGAARIVERRGRTGVRRVHAGKVPRPIPRNPLAPGANVCS